MAVSMFYEQFGVFIFTVLAGFILWISTQPQAFDNEGIKKGAHAGDTDANEK